MHTIQYKCDESLFQAIIFKRTYIRFDNLFFDMYSGMENFANDLIHATNFQAKILSKIIFELFFPLCCVFFWYYMLYLFSWCSLFISRFQKKKKKLYTTFNAIVHGRLLYSCERMMKKITYLLDLWWQRIECRPIQQQHKRLLLFFAVSLKFYELFFCYFFL